MNMHWSTTTSIFLTSLLSNVICADLAPSSSVWQPHVGAPFQIVLSMIVDGNSSATPLQPPHVDIFDVDLFDTSKATIQALKGMGKKVICYFSAGTSEDWREDYKLFRADHQGARLPMWKGEKWLDIRKPDILEIMKKRMTLAKEKGCDAVDPDNMDGYDNERGGGFLVPLTARDTIKYMRQLSQYSVSQGMSIGLKNSLDVLKFVENDIHFAVNEECGNEGADGCDRYETFVNPTTGPGKPVFHIEYVNRIPIYDGAKASPSSGAASPIASPDTKGTAAPLNPLISLSPQTTHATQTTQMSSMESKASQAPLSSQAPGAKGAKGGRGGLLGGLFGGSGNLGGGGLFGGTVNSILGGLGNLWGLGPRPSAPKSRFQGYREDMRVPMMMAAIAAVSTDSTVQTPVVIAQPTPPSASSQAPVVPAPVTTASGFSPAGSASSASTLSEARADIPAESTQKTISAAASPVSHLSPNISASSAVVSSVTASSATAASAVTPSPIAKESKETTASQLNSVSRSRLPTIGSPQAKSSAASSALPAESAHPKSSALSASTAAPVSSAAAASSFSLLSSHSARSSFTPRSSSSPKTPKSPNFFPGKSPKTPTRYEITLGGAAGLLSRRMSVEAIREKLCVRKKETLSNKLSTVIKVLSLDGWVMECDGKEFETKASAPSSKLKGIGGSQNIGAGLGGAGGASGATGAGITGAGSGTGIANPFSGLLGLIGGFFPPRTSSNTGARPTRRSHVRRVDNSASYSTDEYSNPPNPYQQYPSQQYPAQPYSNQPYQPYAYQPYLNQPYLNQPYPNQQYPNQQYQNQPYPNQPYPNQPYPYQQYPYQQYSNQPYPNQPYPNQVYNSVSGSGSDFNTDSGSEDDGIYTSIILRPFDNFDETADRALEEALDRELAGVDLTPKRQGSVRERRGMEIYRMLTAAEKFDQLNGGEDEWDESEDTDGEMVSRILESIHLV